MFAGSRKKVGSKDKITTQKATKKEKVCTFYFPVYEDENCERLYIRKNSGCCWSHRGHTLEDKSLMREGKRDVPVESLETAKKLLEENLSSSFVKEYLKVTTGVQLSTDSIQSIRMSVMVSKFDNLKGDSKGKGHDCAYAHVSFID